jgi:hypothetical protein
VKSTFLPKNLAMSGIHKAPSSFFFSLDSKSKIKVCRALPIKLQFTQKLIKAGISIFLLSEAQPI